MLRTAPDDDETTAMHGAYRPVALIAALALTLSACTSIETTVHKADTIDFDLFRTFAWIDREDELLPAEPALLERAQAAAAAELEAIGMQPAERHKAELLIEFRFATEERVRNRDPYFAADTIERYEDGLLTLIAIDPAYMRDLWTGTARARIRTVARGGGVLSANMNEVDEERDWPLEAMVAELFDEFPPRTRRTLPIVE